MATSTNAFVSVDDIVYSWLLNQGKTIHSYWKALPLAAECVRELAMTSLSTMVQHTILTKEPGQTWFELPQGYSGWVSAGLRQGEWWRPVGISDRLMPMPRMIGNGEYADDDFSGRTGDLNVDGDFTNWRHPQPAAYPASFWDGSYSGGTFQTSNSSSPSPDPHPDHGGHRTGLIPFGGIASFAWADWFNTWGELTGRRFGMGDGYRPDVITINPELGVIMCPEAFPGNHLYLVYTSIETVDSMTMIPVSAQKTIESYIDWKYQANKRNVSRNALADLERLYHAQHRILRSRIFKMSIADIRLIVSRNYGQTQAV